MSDDTTTEETQHTQEGESEEAYYARIKSAPGIFSDFNETAKDLVERPEALVEDSRLRAKATPLSPDSHTPVTDVDDEGPRLAYDNTFPGVPGVNIHEDSAEESAEIADEEKAEDEESTETSDEEQAEDAPTAADGIEGDSTGPAGDVAAQLPSEEQAGQPPRPSAVEPQSAVVSDDDDDEEENTQ